MIERKAHLSEWGPEGDRTRGGVHSVTCLHLLWLNASPAPGSPFLGFLFSLRVGLREWQVHVADPKARCFLLILMPRA